MLEYMFGDTPKVRVIEFVINYNGLKFPSKKEIAKGARIPLEEFDEVYDDLIDIGFIIRDEDKDEHWIASLKLLEGLFSIIKELKIAQYRKHRDSCMQNINSELDKLSKDYTLRKTDELKEYLKEYDILIPYIHSITPSINKYFPNHEKYLTYNIDPEFEELNRAKYALLEMIRYLKGNTN